MIRVSPTKSVLSLSEPAVVETKQSVNLLCYSPWTLNELYICNNSCKCSTKHATTAHPVKIKEAYFPTFMQTELKTKERCYEHFEAYIYILYLNDPPFGYFWRTWNLFVSREIKSSVGRFFGQRSIALWLAAIGDIDSDSWICIFQKNYLWKDLAVYIYIYI